MPPFRYPGPICQTKDWYDGIEDGTLARMPSPVPPSTGSITAPKPALRVSAHGKCSFLNPQPVTNVTAPQEAFDRLRKSSGAAKISAPVPKADEEWPDKSKSPAIEQEVKIDGQKIVVIRPAEKDANGKNLPTVQQVAEALRAIPARQRAHTNKVIVSPTASPNSSPGGITAGEGGSGEIDLYPLDKLQTQNDFDNRVMHESGHNTQGTLWRTAGDAAQWQTVADADPRPPSHYAATNPGDDFCEFNILYNTAKGTSCEAVAKQIYPNRWKKMEEYQSP